MENADFIEGLRKQDPRAAKHLSECFVPSIWRFVFFRVHCDSHLAEDIVAETVLQLISAAAAGTEIENPAGWLRTVAQRRIQDHFRAAARVQHLIEQVPQQSREVEEQDPAIRHDKKLKRESVRDAMDGLPENYRMVLEWKYVDQLSVKVIAERLGGSVKSAESILFRARKALRNRLQPEYPHPPGAAPSTPMSTQPPLTDVSANRCGDRPSQGDSSQGDSSQGNSSQGGPSQGGPSQGGPPAYDSGESSLPERPTMFRSPRIIPET